MRQGWRLSYATRAPEFLRLADLQSDFQLATCRVGMKHDVRPGHRGQPYTSSSSPMASSTACCRLWLHHGHSLRPRAEAGDLKWMAFKARNSAGLEADVDKILDGFDSDYRMTFCQALTSTVSTASEWPPVTFAVRLQPKVPCQTPSRLGLRGIRIRHRHIPPSS